MESQTYIRRSRSKIIFASIIILLVSATATIGQTPTPTPDKRDIGLQTNQQTTSPADQNKSKETKPELVLQTGYNAFYGATRLGFSAAAASFLSP